MKLLKNEEDNNIYLSKRQWTRVLTAVTIMTLVLYIAAMICSLCGSPKFILRYDNEQMNRIEAFTRGHHIHSLISWAFSTLEFFIVSCFILKQKPKWYVILAFYLPMAIVSDLVSVPSIVYTVFPFLFYIIVPLFYFKGKDYGKAMLRLLVAAVITFVLQVMIYVIKEGNWSFQNHILSLSIHFIYAIEYDIALSVILITISLYAYRGKGDNLWTAHHTLGGFSQTSTKQSQKFCSRTNLTKLQKNKLRLLYVKFFLTQILGFLIVMALPFVVGKVVEFLIMYLSFAIVRYILGFKYSLHYKKETLCITVGTVVFGILSLVVPFFYVLAVTAIAYGTGLAVLLHLSYKYKGMVLFNKVAKPDKFALLYVFFEGDLTEHHVKKMCCLKGLDVVETGYIWDFVEGNKLSYLAWKYNYSQRMFIYKLDAAIQKLTV